MAVAMATTLDDGASTDDEEERASKAAFFHELERRHGTDERFLTAERQAGRIGRLIARGEVRGTLLVVRPAVRA